jgi:hypothetical protein
MPPSKKVAIGVTVVALLIFAAAFMPWGEVRVGPELESVFGKGFPAFANPFQGMQVTVTITGWNGQIAPVGLKLPNWLVVLAAAGVSVLCWLKASSVWNAPIAVPVGVAGYGLLHTGYTMVNLMTSGHGSAGVGAFLTVLAFVGILAILIQNARIPMGASQPHQQPTGH